MKSILGVIAIVFLVLLVGGCQRSDVEPGRAEQATEPSNGRVLVQDMAPVCPIEGGHVEDVKSAPSAEYEGKRYFFCCTSCKAEFERDPQKYAAGFEEKLKAHSKEGHQH